MTYRAFLFLAFQICSQIVANTILFVATQRFTFAESVATNPAKNIFAERCLVLTLTS